ncbi:MAG: two-component regulator propeller domain-containing protein [Limisphaerales bacterium]
MSFLGGIGHSGCIRAQAVPVLAILIAAAIHATRAPAGELPLEEGRSTGARSYVFKTWDTEDGLPQMTPTAITQTRDGYLWVGTYNGLARFDGVRFSTFTVNNTAELISDHILALHEDGWGMLWIGTAEGGLVTYQYGRMENFGGKKTGGSVSVSAVAEDENGIIWAATSEGLWMISGGSNGKRMVSAVLLPGLEVIAVVRGGPREIWASTPREVYKFFGTECIEKLAGAGEIQTVALDGQGELWVSYAAGGIGRRSEETGRLDVTGRTAKLHAMHLAHDGKLFAGTLSGELWQIDRGLTNYHRSETKLSERIVSVYADRDANIWAGVEAKGLWRLRRSLVAHLGTRQGLLTPNVTSLCEDRHGRIWAGTFGKGLHWWDGEKFNSIKMPLAANITAVLEDRFGKLWFGTYGGALGWREEFSGGVVLDTGNRYAQRCRSLFEDSAGGLWMGTLNHGVEHHYEGGMQRFGAADGLTDNHVRAIAEDAAGNVWVGTSKGLNRIAANGSIQQFHVADGLAGEQVRALFRDTEGTLWIGSTGGGLTRWKDGKLESLGLKEGLSNEWIEQIVQDDHGYLWLGSNGGLMRVNLQQLNDCFSHSSPFVHCTVFRREEGLILPNSGSGFQPSALKTSDGKLWFASDAGIAIIDPREVRVERKSPAVYIEEVLVDEQRQSIYGESTLQPLPAGSHRLEFRYTGLDSTAPALVRFRHKLEGFDSDWVNAAVRREAVYTRLPPGEYRFRVLAANNQGNWNEEGASLAFSILPRFWQTQLFQITAAMLSVFFTGLIVWGVISGKHRRELELLKRTHELERERTRIAQDMHDGLGSSLVKISLLGEQAERRFHEADGAEPQVRKMTAAARQVVREMDEIVWAVNPRNDTLENFAGYICAFAREHFSDTSLECHLDFPAELPIKLLRAEVRHNLFLAVREALNNVLKHSQAQHVWVKMDVVDDHLVINVRDDGKGFSAADHNAGNGLGNMRERLRHLGGVVELAGTAAGTNVRFALSLK